MSDIDLGQLVGRLGDYSRGCLEEATRAAINRTNYNVEIEHYIISLVGEPNADMAICLKNYNVEIGELCSDLQKSLERVRSGNSRSTGFSMQMVTLLREAWLFASISGNAGRVRSGHILVALLGERELAAVARDASPEFLKVSPEALRESLAEITKTSIESTVTGDRTSSETSAARPAGAPMSGSALGKFTIDLTKRARDGHIDPVLGRDGEIRQIVDILMRRRQNNPILTGEAGVGKTAVVEGFARLIASGEAPEPMRNVSVLSLDLGLLQAGAGVKGEFESRLKGVIDEVRDSPQPIVLFIDEAHTLIGAGGAAGQGDAANLLKPALARGDLRTIAATTWAEYKKYFERDAALARRFQVVKVDEPDEARAIAMLRGVVGVLEKHHGVRILDEAVVDAVRLSSRYIPARQLPDKAVSVLDTACGRVAMSQTATPAAIVDRRRRLEVNAIARNMLTREATLGADHAGRLGELDEERVALEAELNALEGRWTQEVAIVSELKEIEAAPSPAPNGKECTTPLGPAEQYIEARDRLATIQGEQPLVQVCVDAQSVVEVIANWTGIPLGRMVENEIRTILGLEETMARRIVGQPHALKAIAEAMQTSRARLTDPRKPIAIFLMVGTSGVGKTESALTLADLVYGGAQSITVINMSEFKEEHKVSMLVGSPPGYVGYGEGGVLTEAVRRRPYSVVLLDEIEKAHPGVQDIFYQVFDKGELRDGEGRDIDFKNTVIIMTSNAASDLIQKLFADADTAPDADGLLEALRPELLKYFKPAFLGRVTVVPYLPLSEDNVRRIVRLQLDRIGARIADTWGAGFGYSDGLVDFICQRCLQSESGARAVESVLTRSILPEVSARFLDSMARREEIRVVNLGLDSVGSITYDFEHV